MPLYVSTICTHVVYTRPVSNITVSLEANMNTFKGFFVQSRAPTPQFDPTAPFIGEFLPSSTAQIRSCGEFVVSKSLHIKKVLAISMLIKRFLVLLI